jgi:putative two-component system response regulator
VEKRITRLKVVWILRNTVCHWRQLDQTMNSHLFPNEQQICAAKILIVDDEDADIRALEWTLRQAGFSNFRSLTVSTQAREEFKQFQPDLVVLDLHMPELDGFGVLKQLREAAPAEEFLPILMLTGDNANETRGRALKAGANDFLSKPIDSTEVTLRIKNLLQTRLLQRQAREIQARWETLSAGGPGTPASSGPKK